MKDKIKKIFIPFILVIIFNLGFSNLSGLWEFGIFAPHIGILFISGLLFGPYGALGSAMANTIGDLYNGYDPILTIPSEIFTFAISLLAYKIWYSNIKSENEITKPSLNNSYHLSLFLFDLFVCAVLYSIAHGNLMGAIVLADPEIESLIAEQYFMNFINISFIFGIISIWISKKIDFIHTPKTTTKTVNKKAYKIILCLLIIFTVINGICLFLPIPYEPILINLVILAILLYAYLTKPFEYEVKEIKEKTISSKVMRIFLITTLIMVILAIIISFILDAGNLINLEGYETLPTSPLLILTNILIILFFIPTYLILRYVEKNMIKPISSFSEIEEFIHENQKIESEGLLEIYSKYLDEENEIGTLARSYTNLINNNNHYIENIHEIESEKERINAELDIARRIQQANLPTGSIETDEYIVDGYSKPAKEVGGDFFDYYEIDSENLAIVIGDASGKGVPAAMLASITQKLIKHLFKSQKDPSQILFQLNNELCENNEETMFITLWLGIYNKTTKIITFSNAGHNRPLIWENGKFKYLEIDTGFVLGVMEDYEFEKEEVKLSKEIIIFTDGITDANNDNKKMYGPERLLSFFNRFNSDGDPIEPLLKDIKSFTQDIEQFDDMTLLYLKDKHD